FLRTHRLARGVSEYVESLVLRDPGPFYEKLPGLIPVLAYNPDGWPEPTISRLEAIDTLRRQIEALEGALSDVESRYPAASDDPIAH
ncbi:hypothetical protein JXA47_02710, partial [Candidatus Sumerlaeota bacterium]|nr:hypothetical protein [Candidatus Sumerlaeota bacterium]